MSDRLVPTWFHDDHPDDAGTVAQLAPADPAVDRLVGALATRGIGRGDAVAWQLPNGDDAVRLLWATWRLGAIAVPIHHRATVTEAAAMLDVLPVRLVVDAEQVPTMIERGTPSKGSVARPRDLALVLHTSGSSGTPKAVLHTQAALAHKARSMTAVHGLGPGDVVLMPAPLGHISGILNGVTVPAAAGMRSVLMARWDPDHALDLIESERVTFMVGPPTFFLGLTDAAGFTPDRVSSLRLVSAGGAGVTESFCAATAGTFDAVVKRTYGSTEAPTMSTARTDDPTDRAWTTDGRAVPGARLRVDATGELQVRGPELFVGYADASRNADAVTDDGWFRTGDLGAIDDGWLTISGRTGDVIIRGGENIAPAEVESHLEAHRSVAQAVVVAEPDERLGERVCAFVTLTTSSEFDLEVCRAWFAERGVARFKTPERVVVLDAFPVLASGKADRAALARRAAT